jgi:hypothetical protein
MSMPMSTARAELAVETSHFRSALSKGWVTAPALSISSELSICDQCVIRLTGIMTSSF